MGCVGSCCASCLSSCCGKTMGAGKATPGASRVLWCVLQGYYALFIWLFATYSYDIWNSSGKCMRGFGKFMKGITVECEKQYDRQTEAYNDLARGPTSNEYFSALDDTKQCYFQATVHRSAFTISVFLLSFALIALCGGGPKALLKFWVMKFILPPMLSFLTCIFPWQMTYWLTVVTVVVSGLFFILQFIIFYDFGWVIQEWLLDVSIKKQYANLIQTDEIERKFLNIIKGLAFGLLGFSFVLALVYEFTGLTQKGYPAAPEGFSSDADYWAKELNEGFTYRPTQTGATVSLWLSYFFVICLTVYSCLKTVPYGALLPSAVACVVIVYFQWVAWYSQPNAWDLMYWWNESGERWNALKLTDEQKKFVRPQWQQSGKAPVAALPLDATGQVIPGQIPEGLQEKLDSLASATTTSQPVDAGRSTMMILMLVATFVLFLRKPQIFNKEEIHGDEYKENMANMMEDMFAEEEVNESKEKSKKASSDDEGDVESVSIPEDEATTSQRKSNGMKAFWFILLHAFAVLHQAFIWMNVASLWSWIVLQVSVVLMLVLFLVTLLRKSDGDGMDDDY